MNSNVRINLKERLLNEEILLAPGVYDSLTALLAERVGFETLYLTGAGVSYSTLGAPDIGLITASEMVNKASYISEAINTPIIADGDTGYGNALNVRRTVKDYEKAGVSAIQLEDQEFPKKCGHLSDKKIIPSNKMAGKIKAAVDARTDDNFLIVARTDARETDSLQEAIERANLYLEAGADILFIEAPKNEKEMAEITKSVKCPLIANMVEGGQTPLFPAKKLEEMGFTIAIYPNSVTRLVAKAAQELYEEILTNGTTSGFSNKMFQFNELNELLNISHYKNLGEIYDS